MNPLNPEDIEDLKQLIDFLKENQVGEFELERGETRIRLKFAQPEGTGAGTSDLAQLLAGAREATVQAATRAPAAAKAAPEAAADPDEGLHIVKSPIVGTYYGSPSPGASPFVGVGDHVDKGQVICIIEAMKLMNEIESDASGEIVKCLVSNGQPIEYGQPLFSIRLG
jgi:acetyl-CoA carboxylase biotin carboxyl carrier protein